MKNQEPFELKLTDAALSGLRCLTEMGGLRGLESKVAETHRTAAELREEVSILQNDQAVAAAQPPMTPKDIQQAVEASALEPGSLLNATVLRIITEAARPAARAVLENTFRG